jgi:hypothetical protein
LKLIKRSPALNAENRIISLFASIDLFSFSVWYRSCSWAAFQEGFFVFYHPQFIFLGFFFLFGGDWGGGWRLFNKLPCSECNSRHPVGRECVEVSCEKVILDRIEMGFCCFKEFLTFWAWDNLGARAICDVLSGFYETLFRFMCKILK